MSSTSPCSLGSGTGGTPPRGSARGCPRRCGIRRLPGSHRAGRRRPAKSGAFARFIDSRPELTHIRTRRRSPQTNGVIERYHGAIKIEQLWRELSADGAEMTVMVEAFREPYNHVRPHEMLAGNRPIERYLASVENEPPDELTTTLPTRQTVRIP